MSLTRTSRPLIKLMNITNQSRSFCHVRRVASTNLVMDRNRVPPMFTYQMPWSMEHVRNYAKGRDKVKHAKKKGAGSVQQMDDDDLAEYVDIVAFREEIETTVEQFKKDIIQKMALRTNIGSYEKLEVKTDEGTFPLNQIATIAQKGQTMLVISLSKNVKYMPAVLEALKTMNINPQQEGQAAVIVTMAKVSREHREEMVKKLKALFNTYKDRLNKVYSKVSNKLPKNDWEVKKKVETQLLGEKTKAVEECEKMMKAKTTELMS